MLGKFAYVLHQNTKLDGGGWFNGKFLGKERYIVLLAHDAKVRPHCEHVEFLLDLETSEVVGGRQLVFATSFNAVLRTLSHDGIYLNGLLPGVPADLAFCYQSLTMAQMNKIADKLERVRSALIDDLHEALGEMMPVAGCGSYNFESTRQAAQVIEVIKNSIEELRARIASVKESPLRGGTIMNNDTVNILQIAADFNIEVPQQ